MTPCDCRYGDEGKCSTCTGEAVFVVKRGRKKMNLCSRCHLFADKKVGRLYEEKDIPRLAALDAGRSIDPFAEMCDLTIDILGGYGEVLKAQLSLPLVEVKG